MSADDVDRYLRELEEPKRGTLEQLRRTILELLPEAEQGLSYGVPAFRVAGALVAGFSAAKSHLSYLPHSGGVLGTLPPAVLEGHAVSKGALRFAVDSPPSRDLVAALVAARMREIAGTTQAPGEPAMSGPGELPAGLELVRTTEEFDERHHPAGLLRAHRVADGVWARLIVRTGELGFVFEDRPDDHRPVAAGCSVVIPPGRLHHVAIGGPVSFVLEFHREQRVQAPAAGAESTGLAPT
jgi:uncharacterized protein YdhG (YjbR/CyaY superfamily)/tellurite resistance-related uncharacterized protein